MFMHTRRVFILFLMAALIVPILAACGGPATVNVSLSSFAIAPSPNSVKAGEVTFKVKNNATDLVHEFVIVKTDMVADQLPTDAAGKVAEDEIKVVDEVEDIAQGASGEITVKLEPGHYVLICNIPGHYMGGMRADFTVTP